MTTGRNLKSVLIAVVLILGTLTTASLASSLLGGNSIPSVRTVHALPGPPLLGVDCALGASADSPNPFPTPITTKDSDGVSDTSCQWAGDFDGDPAATFDPLVSDSPELASSGLGGGFIANVIYTNMNNTINAFDITVNYNPAVLDFVQFDQTGLLFGGNVNCPPSSPSCTLQLAASVDRVSGVVRLAQAVEQTTVGPGATNPALNVNAVTFFRMRFDVVGAGATSLTFGRNIITFAVGVNTGPESHSTQNSAFSTESLFQLTNGVVTGSFNESWTFSPNPEVPFAPLTFSAAAANCNFCTAPFTYQWDFSSFDSSGYVAKVNATGQTVSVTAPPQAINRVTLTVTDSAVHSVTAVRRLPIAAAAQGPATAAVGVVSAPFKSGYLGGVSAECSGSTCTGTGSTGFTGTWRFCPGSGIVKTVCSNPNAAASTDPASILGISWLFAGLYTTVFSVTDSGPSQIGGPQTATQIFPVNVTGAPPAYTVTVTSNVTGIINAGTAVNVTAVTAYSSSPSYPVSFRASLFTYDFNWGDGSPDTIVSGTTAAFSIHTYAFGGNFIVRVTPQESAAAAPTSIKENGYSPVITVFDYNLLVTPNPVTVSAGSGTTASLAATLTGGTSQSVSFVVTGQPAGTTITLNPTSCNLSCTSQVSVTTSATTLAGTYPITIKATAAGGLIKTTAFNLKVTFAVAISCPSTGTIGTAISCTATSTGGTAPVAFSWTATGGTPSSGTGATFSTTYNAGGPKQISVTATDAATPPNTDTATATVTISAGLTVTISCPATGTVGTAVTCTVASTGGTGTVTFAWTATGGSPSSGSGSSFSTTYSVKGSKTISVTGTDSATPTPATDTKSASVNIAALTLSVAPTVPTTGTVGTSVGVSATAIGGTSPYTFTWDFGDGSGAVSGATASHTYTAKGTFTVKVTVTDANAVTASNTASITISPLTLATDFTFPATITPGTAASFTATTTGGTSPYSYAWTFGDGTTGTGNPVSHTYSSSGPFTVTVTVTDANAKTATASHSVGQATPLTVTITCPGTGTVGAAVLCSATGSGGTPPVTFSWTATGGNPASGTGASFSTAYNVKGTFSISVTGTDSATPTPNTQTKSASVMISALALTVAPTVPSTGTVGTSVSVSATASGGTSPYAFSWDFGDGTALVSGSTASHTYTAKGTLTVKVTVTDTNTVSASNTASITVSALPLTTDFAVSPTTVTPNSPVTFTATTSGGTSPYTYAWDFGDGTTGTGSPVDHTYSTTGPFTVVLTVTDANAKTATATHTIGSAPPFIVTITCPTTGTVGATVNCTTSATGGTAPYTFAWTATGGTPGSGTGTSFSTTYDVKGSKTISVTGTDSATPTPATDTKSASVNIAALTLGVTPTVPTTGTVGTAVSVSATATGGTSPYTFSWDFGDGSAAVTGATASHTYTAKGSFTVKVTVTDVNAVTASNTASITISPLALATDFTFPATITPGVAAGFTATTSGGTTPYTYAWDFGDTTTGSGNPVSHIYSTTGPFTVVLTVTDANAKTATATHTIGSTPPFTVTISCPTTDTVNAPVNCTVSATGGTAPYSFAWTATGGTPASGTGTSFTTTYSVKGSNTISVTGTDSATPTPGSDTKSATVTIAALTLTVDLPTVPTGGGTVGTPISVSSNALGGTTPYAFSWDFGDGTATVTGQTASHTYTAKGSFTIKVTVTDANAATASNTAMVTISPVALSVTIAGPTTGGIGAPITFTATGAGGTAPYAFAWTATGGTPSSGAGATFITTYDVFGTFTVDVTITDGNAKTATASATVVVTQGLFVTISCPTTGTVNSPVSCIATATGGTAPITFAWTATGGTPSSGTGASFATTYSTKGTDLVAVTGTDATGATATNSATITISPLDLTTDFNVSPTPIVANSPITFSATTSGGTAAYTYSWDFGDSTTGTGNPATHTYLTTGPFTVVETVTDANGKTASATHTIGSAATLVVTINCPTSGTVGIVVNCTAAATGGTPPITFAWTSTGGTPSSGTGSSFSTIYNTKGTFSISVTGTDSATPTPNIQAQSASITITPVVLSGDFAFSPTAPTNATAVTFTATVTGGTAPYSFVWSFGDGTGSSVNPAVHTFAAGTFTVMLNVTDANGAKSIASHTITVVSTGAGQPILLTFQAFNFTAFHNGIGPLQVLVNGKVVVTFPFVRSATILNPDSAPGANQFISLGPFDITAFVVQGQNNITFLNPTASRFSLIKNVAITQGSTIFLKVSSARSISSSHSVTFTFSNPPLTIKSFTVSNNNPFAEQDVTFTATFTGGTAPFKCLFRFGNDNIWGVRGSNGSCSVTTDYDDPGTFSASVRITGATTGDIQNGSLTVNVMPDPGFTTEDQDIALQSLTAVGLQSFSISVVNPSDVSVIFRVDFRVVRPDGTSFWVIGKSQTLQPGQTLALTFPSGQSGGSAPGQYTFLAAFKFGFDTNHDGVLQSSEKIVTSGYLNGTFTVPS